MELGGRQQQVLLRDYTMHAYKPQVMHRRLPASVDATTKITKNAAALRQRGDSPAVKTEHCLVNHVVNELLIQCLASQRRSTLTIDLTYLATRGQTLTVADLKLPGRHLVVTHGKKNLVIVSVTAQATEGRAGSLCGGRGGSPMAAAAAPAKGKAPAKDKEKGQQEVTVGRAPAAHSSTTPASAGRLALGRARVGPDNRRMILTRRRPAIRDLSTLRRGTTPVSGGSDDAAAQLRAHLVPDCSFHGPPRGNPARKARLAARADDR